MVTSGTFMIFPNTGMQVLACLIHFLGLAVITHCLSRRLTVVNFGSWEEITQITLPRALALMIFLDSWAFVFASGVLIFGVGLERSHSICSIGILLCVLFYATSKLLIYTFLIEKVHIVWSPTTGLPRLKSPVYLICFVTVLLYLVIIGLLLFGRITFLRHSDAVCVIGLKPYSSIPLLSYDLYINILLTGLFLWPLFRSGVATAPVKKVAFRTLLASGVALTTSTVNMTVMTVMKGKQLGWVCLGSCAADVVVNAVAIFWVTRGLDATLYSSTKSPSRGLPDRERRHTTAFVDGVSREAPKATLSGNQPSFGYFPETSFAEPPRVERNRDIESGHRRPPSTYKTIKSLTGIFRSSKSQEPEGGLKITVTTEYELEESHIQLDSIQEEEERKKKQRLSKE